MSKQIIDAINGKDFAKFLSVVSSAEDEALREALLTVELEKPINKKVAQKVILRSQLDERAVELFFEPRFPPHELTDRGDGWSKEGLSSRQAKLEVVKAGCLLIKLEGMMPLQLNRMQDLLEAVARHLKFRIDEALLEFTKLYQKCVQLQAKEGEQKGESKDKEEATYPIFRTTAEFANFLKALPYPRKSLSPFLQEIKNSSHLVFIPLQKKDEFEGLLELIPSYAIKDFLALYTSEQLRAFYKDVGSIKDPAAFLKLIRKAPQLLHHFKELPVKGNTHVDRLYDGKKIEVGLIKVLYVLPEEKEYRDAFFDLFSDMKHLHNLLEELRNYLDGSVYRDADKFQAYVHACRVNFPKEVEVDGETKLSAPTFKEIKPEEAFDRFTDVAIELYLRYRAGIKNKKTGETQEYKSPVKSLFGGDTWVDKQLAVAKFRAEIKAKKQIQAELKGEEKKKDDSPSSPVAALAGASVVANKVEHALTNNDVKRIYARWHEKELYSQNANEAVARAKWVLWMSEGKGFEAVKAAFTKTPPPSRQLVM